LIYLRFIAEDPTCGGLASDAAQYMVAATFCATRFLVDNLCFFGV